MTQGAGVCEGTGEFCGYKFLVETMHSSALFNSAAGENPTTQVFAEKAEEHTRGALAAVGNCTEQYCKVLGTGLAKSILGMALIDMNSTIRKI